MVCKKCGAPIKDGHLYCEKCGEEIQIVPEFETEIEDSIQTHLSNVAEENDEKTAEANVEDDSSEGNTDTSHNKELSRSKKLAIMIACFVGLVVVIVMIFSANKIKRYYSYDYQYSKAVGEYDRGNYSSSINTVKHAIAINPKSEDAKILLADNYYEIGKYDESIATLLELKERFPLDYGINDKLIKNYEAINDEQAIEELLKVLGRSASNNENKNEFYLDPPTFNMEEGEYENELTVTLSHDIPGKIYYTLDGSKPTKESMEYKDPIYMVAGTITVSAVFENVSGIMSEPVSKTYTIVQAKEEEILEAVPTIKTKAGKTHNPELIVVSVPDDVFVLYTTDGTDPTIESEEYTRPIPMPIEKTEYRFACFDKSGNSGEVVSATYELQMVTLFDIQTAKSAVEFYNISIPNSTEGAQYSCDSAIALEGKNMYVFYEYVSEKGKMVKTGRVYGVDVMAGTLYRIDMTSKNGEYSINPL